MRVMGPFLILDDVKAGRVHISALVITSEDDQLAPLISEEGPASFETLLVLDGRAVQRARFSTSITNPGRYEVAGQHYALSADMSGDMRIAFASCNGEEHGDLARADEERNVMWARLRAEHEKSPYALLLQGGDQIYADEATKGHALSEDWPDSLPKDPSHAELDDLRTHLRRGFFERYLNLWQSPDYAWLAARVPQLSQWDDHDICDGWGSLSRSRTYSPVGQVLFDVAQEMALLFQHGTVAGDLPTRFHDPKAYHMGWSIDLPGLRVMAPDLRSERTRRQIMGEGGWQMMTELAARHAPERVLMISSVPLLGPRLSVFEALMIAIPKMQQYEDDLRDQWQSRAHREEWRRMLKLIETMATDTHMPVTVLSGEIHLATRATMETRDGVALHQLVASGVTHRPPPQAWARVLGALAWFGEDPLPGQPIKIRPIPGQRHRYIAERNTLHLSRKEGRWCAQWDFEHRGMSDPLTL